MGSVTCWTRVPEATVHGQSSEQLRPAADEGVRRENGEQEEPKGSAGFHQQGRVSLGVLLQTQKDVTPASGILWHG